MAIAKEMKRDPRTVRKVTEYMNFTRKVRSDIGEDRISPRDMTKIPIVAKKCICTPVKLSLTQLALVDYVVRHIVPS